MISLLSRRRRAECWRRRRAESWRLRRSLFRLGNKALPIALALLSSIPARAAGVLPSFAEVRRRHPSSDGRLFDREGRLLQEQRLSWEGRVLEWVPLEDVSPALKEAVVNVEDRRFREHGGVDFRALVGARARSRCRR